MDLKQMREFVAARWDADAMPALTRYVSIPCVSPAFEPDWLALGHMDAAVELLADWARSQLRSTAGATVKTLRLPGRTPLLLVDVPAHACDPAEPVVIYGHLDKQPEMEGWSDGRSAWTPVVDGDRLFGRGAADDGYAVFGALLAILALDDQSLPRPRCLVIVEASEESGSGDLPHYIDLLAPRLGSPALIVALDSMCGDYDRLWVTTSLRGQVAGTLSVRVLSEGVHSGEASGIVPSSFRVATLLLARLEDQATGTILPEPFIVDVPPERRAEAAHAAEVLGPDAFAGMPFVDGAGPVADDPSTLLIQRSWMPQLAVTGADGLPPISGAGAVLLPGTDLKLSLRVPPTLDPLETGRALKALLEADPPYGAHVRFEPVSASSGWHSPEPADWLAAALEDGSRAGFGRAPVRYGGGGGIPFLSMLGARFPHAQFLVTGVLGPNSNAHGPDEFLHLPTARAVTVALAVVLAAAGRRELGANLVTAAAAAHAF